MLLSDNDLITYLEAAALSLAFLVPIIGVIWWTRHLKTLFPQTAKKYRLTYSRDDKYDSPSLGNIINVERLQGVVNGTPISVESKYQTLGNSRLHNTVLISPARVTGMEAGTINVSTYYPKTTAHLVRTGNKLFDARRWVTSDKPNIVGSLLTPSVQEALLRFPRGELHLILDGQRLILTYASPITSQRELNALIDTLLAAANADYQDDRSNTRALTVDMDYLEQLGKAHGFTLDELQANRQGLLHPAQVAKGGRSSIATFFLFVFGITTLAAGALSSYLYYRDLGNNPSQIDLNALYLMLFGTLLISSFFIYMGWQSYCRHSMRQAAFAKGSVDIFEGALEKRIIRRENSWDYIFYVAGRLFHTTQKIYELLTQGAHYRCYCTDDVLLSFEPVAPKVNP